MAIRLSSNFLTIFLTLSLLFFQSPDSLELLDDGWEGVGDDGDHDEEGEEEDEDGGHDQLDVRARHSPVLLKTVFANSRQDRGCILKHQLLSSKHQNKLKSLKVAKLMMKDEVRLD